MDKTDENKPLLKASDTALDDVPKLVVPNRRVFSLELIAVLYFASIMAMLPIQQFYVIDQISKKYGKTKNEEKVDYCPNNTDPSNSTDNMIQSESANVLMFLGFFSTFIAVIPILILGAVTDIFGRKIPLVISMIGLLLKEIVMIVTIYKGLSLWFLVIGEFFLGITGHFGSSLAALMGMVADITTPGRSRAIRISILEAVVAVSLSLSTLGVGFWIKDGNYKHPLIMCIALTVLAIILTVLILPETSLKRKESSLCSRKMLGACIQLYTSGNKRRSRLLIIGQIIFCINVGALLGKSNVVTLFLLHRPLCWSEVHVQVFSCIQILLHWGSVIIGIRILHKYLNDYGIVILGTVAAVASSVTFAFGEKDWIIYLYVFVGIMAYSVSPMLRSLLSRLVSADEQGSLFASVGSLELLLTALAQLFYGEIYKETVSYSPGLVFLIMAGILVIEFCLSLVLYKMMSEPPVHVEEVVVEGS